MPRAYLDSASTAPARPGVVEAMLPWLSTSADPGRVHTEGRMARAAIEDARDAVAALCGARSREVVFTSGATEAINAVAWGTRDRRAVITAVEHSAVRESTTRFGEPEVVGVDGVGRVDVETLREVVREGDVVHCQWGNHEVGTLQPVAEIVALCRERGALVHIDAAQAVGRVRVSFSESGADLMSVSAHKFGGPKGMGALVVRRGLRLDPMIVGGDQERARRAGLEDVAAIAGFGAAAVSAAASVDDEAAAARRHRRALLDAALSVPGVVAYGDRSEAGSLPHIACVGVEGVEAEAVLLGLDQVGIAAHSGSACSSESLEPSPVLLAMGVDAERSLRVSVGWHTTDDDVQAFAAAFPGVVGRLRSLGSLPER